MQLAAGLGWTSLPFLPLIRQRTLFLAGTDDPLIPMANAHIMRRLLPNAALHTYDDGHLGFITRAADLGPLVAHFLRTRTASRSSAAGPAPQGAQRWHRYGDAAPQLGSESAGNPRLRFGQFGEGPDRGDGCR